VIIAFYQNNILVIFPSADKLDGILDRTWDKTENILLDKEHKIIKVIDFGL
jgi:hypothetical protein